MQINPETSNFTVLCIVIDELEKCDKADITAEHLIKPLEDFLKPKRKIEREADKLRIKATLGDSKASSEYITKICELGN